jgi:hypothetical protein
MKRPYSAPALQAFGSLAEITMGAGGSSPDVGGLNINCFTALVGTVLITCASAPTRT